MTILNNINEIGKLNSFKEHYLRSDLTLEKKATSFWGRVAQWVKRLTNPTLYKAEYAFRALITHLSFDANHTLNEYGAFKDLATRLDQADKSRCALLKQNTRALKIYRAAQFILNQASSSANQTNAPYRRILNIAFESCGYNEIRTKFKVEKVINRFIKLEGFVDFLNKEKDQQKVGLYLFRLAEYVTNARKSMWSMDKFPTLHIVYDISYKFGA